MLYQIDYWNHVAGIQKAAAELGLKAHMDMANLQLTISDGTKNTHWFPRFVNNLGPGQFAYSEQRTETTTGFIGWLPYRMRAWETATSKLAFKTYAAQHGVATPAACVDPGMIRGPFIVKKLRSSFGAGIRGPYPRYDPAAPQQQLQEGECYENFIPGQIVKASYWGVTLGAVEFRRMPAVAGNGTQTLRQLVEALAPKPGARPHDWEAIGGLARLCGLESADSVPAAGQEVLIDFKYGSRYEPLQRKNRNIIGEIRGTPLAAQLDRAGETLVGSIGKEHDGATTFYTLDAMVDAEGTVLFLEMNSNPMVPPDMYALMLESIFEDHAMASRFTGASSSRST